MSSAGEQVLTEPNRRRFASNSDDADSGCAMGEYTWVPPGLKSAELIHKYYCRIPEGKIPYVDTIGERYRVHQLLLQLPPHDSDPRYCQNLTEAEKREFQVFTSLRKERAFGRGTVAHITNNRVEIKCAKCEQPVVDDSIAVLCHRMVTASVAEIPDVVQDICSNSNDANPQASSDKRSKCSTKQLPNLDRSSFGCSQSDQHLIGAKAVRAKSVNSTILDADDITLASRGMFHPECFVCSSCSELLIDLTYFLHEGTLFCGRHYCEQIRPRCAACDEIIFADECTEAEGRSWHTHHFLCSQCESNLGGDKYILRDGHPYCCTCFDNLFAELCETCGDPIGVDEGQMAHDGQHWHSTAECFCCQRCKCSLLGKPFLPKYGNIFCSADCARNFASGSLTEQCKMPIEETDAKLTKSHLFLSEHDNGLSSHENEVCEDVYSLKGHDFIDETLAYKDTVNRHPQIPLKRRVTSEDNHHSCVQNTKSGQQSIDFHSNRPHRSLTVTFDDEVVINHISASVQADSDIYQRSLHHPNDINVYSNRYDHDTRKEFNHCSINENANSCDRADSSCTLLSSAAFDKCVQCELNPKHVNSLCQDGHSDDAYKCVQVDNISGTLNTHKCQELKRLPFGHTQTTAFKKEIDVSGVKSNSQIATRRWEWQKDPSDMDGRSAAHVLNTHSETEARDALDHENAVNCSHAPIIYSQVVHDMSTQDSMAKHHNQGLRLIKVESNYADCSQRGVSDDSELSTNRCIVKPADEKEVAIAGNSDDGSYIDGCNKHEQLYFGTYDIIFHGEHRPVAFVSSSGDQQITDTSNTSHSVCQTHSRTACSIEGATQGLTHLLHEAGIDRLFYQSKPKVEEQIETHQKTTTKEIKSDPYLPRPLKISQSTNKPRVANTSDPSLKQMFCCRVCEGCTNPSRDPTLEASSIRDPYDYLIDDEQDLVSSAKPQCRFANGELTLLKTHCKVGHQNPLSNGRPQKQLSYTCQNLEKETNGSCQMARSVTLQPDSGVNMGEMLYARDSDQAVYSSMPLGNMQIFQRHAEHVAMVNPCNDNFYSSSCNGNTRMKLPTSIRYTDSAKCYNDRGRSLFQSTPCDEQQHISDLCGYPSAKSSAEQYPNRISEAQRVIYDNRRRVVQQYDQNDSSSDEDCSIDSAWDLPHVTFKDRFTMQQSGKQHARRNHSASAHSQQTHMHQKSISHGRRKSITDKKANKNERDHSAGEFRLMSVRIKENPNEAQDYPRSNVRQSSTPPILHVPTVDTPSNWTASYCPAPTLSTTQIPTICGNQACRYVSSCRGKGNVDQDTYHDPSNAGVRICYYEDDLSSHSAHALSDAASSDNRIGQVDKDRSTAKKNQGKLFLLTNSLNTKVKLPTRKSGPSSVISGEQTNIATVGIHEAGALNKGRNCEMYETAPTSSTAGRSGKALKINHLPSGILKKAQPQQQQQQHHCVIS